MNLEAAWLKILRELDGRTELRAWSRDSGYTTTTFRVTHAQPGSIEVRSLSLSQPRTITKTDFARVAAVWEGYCNGEMTRVQTVQVSQNTSYIFGLLKWVEDQAVN